ncbi:MAG: hypothetical protein EP343_01725 [Deltaproteobacteria bacterium]|nr:MAG: hypothetical protein EP343_01725 [Deltaproteobacteria bacterium]
MNKFVPSRRVVVSLLTLAFGLGWMGFFPTQEAEAKRRTVIKYRKGGFLFAASSRFPTSGDSIGSFIRLGRKHSRRNPVRVSRGTVQMNALLVLKKAYRTGVVNFVLYKRGKHKHLDSQQVRVQNGKLQLFVTPLQFQNKKLKPGRYELRATVVRRYGRTYRVTVLARHRFRIR